MVNTHALGQGEGTLPFKNWLDPPHRFDIAWPLGCSPLGKSSPASDMAWEQSWEWEGEKAGGYCRVNYTVSYLSEKVCPGTTRRGL